MTTTYFLNQVMGNLFHAKENPALPGDYYIGLSATEPGVDGSGVSEPASSAGYKRVKLTVLSEPTAGVIKNTAAVSFDESTANWGTMTHFVIYDALTGGNLLMFDELSSARNVETATIVTIKAGSLTLTLSNPA